MNTIDFQVFVFCATYNQSKYIVNTMDGFAMQKTSFPYVCFIIDDASTDGEQLVIKEYLEKNFRSDVDSGYFEREFDYGYTIYANHKSNKNCYFHVLFLNDNHYSKGKSKNIYHHTLSNSIPYFAMCEGDDYWIDSNKLQLQYDYMTNNPNCSLCFHKYDILLNDELNANKSTYKENYDLIDVAAGIDLQTATMFYRNVGEPLIPNNFHFRYQVYQFFMVVRLAEFGYIHYIDKTLSVYRVNQGGIYSQQDLRRKFEMALGNIDNMIDWYSQRVIRDDVVLVLKRRARLLSKGFIKIALRQRKVKDLAIMLKRYIRYIG